MGAHSPDAAPDAARASATSPDAHPRQRAAIIVYGDVIDDIVVLPDGPLRLDTDTDAVIRTVPGGQGANVASWLASLGATVDLVGCIGAGDTARLAPRLVAAGVRTHLAEHPQLPTGAIVLLIAGEQRTMLTQRGANAALRPDQVTAPMLDGAAALYLSGYSILGASDPGGVRSLIARSLQRGVEVVVDPASAGMIADAGADALLSVIAGVGILLPNLDEGRALTGLIDPREIVVELGRRFPVVALTLGPDGALIVQSGADPVLVPATPSALVDPTGAGDAFAAGFMVSFLRDRDAVRAAREGADAAAVAVAAIGGRPE